MNKYWPLIVICVCLLMGKLSAQVTPFSTSGAKIIDANGSVVQLKGVNWWGANGSLIPYSDGEHSKQTNTHSMPFGLHVQDADTIIAAIKQMGFNAVRFPFSNEMLHDATPAQTEWVGPNSEFTGLTPLQVMDALLEKLTNAGLFVLLNNHSTTAHWCCNYDFNGLWFGKNKFYSQTTAQWIRDWEMLADRYLSNPMIIGADLRNEVRPLRKNVLPFPRNPVWGGGSKRDWHKAAEDAGNAILRKNPNWIVVVEGINAQARMLTILRFPHLKPIRKNPVVLDVPHKLIYEVHNYSFSWLKANLLFPKKQVKYQQMDSASRHAAYTSNWGFVVDDAFEHQTPVIIGEFGCSSLSPEVEPWLKDLTNFIQEKQLGFFWWTLEEELYNDGSYGLLNETLNEPNVINDWRWKHLQPLLNRPSIRK